MYMAFTEEQAVNIRKIGLTVIEYKRCIRKGIDILWYVAKTFAEKAARAFKIFSNAVSEAFDNLRFAFEELRDYFNYETGTRYKVVKFLSKCGFNKYDMWKRIYSSCKKQLLIRYLAGTSMNVSAIKELTISGRFREK